MSDNVDYSDNSDVDSETEATGSKSRKAAKSYVIRHALQVPRATTYTTQALFAQIHNNDIDLEPEYQREVVWTDDKQIRLIDSILRNYYIPPIIFAVQSKDDGTEHRTCIDGKQRLTSIHRFMEGLIPHRDHATNQKFYYQDNPDAKDRSPKHLLPEKYRTVFANKQIVCVEYHELTESAERDIFQRVQNGLALTPSEKLGVINTPRSKFVRELMADYIKADPAILADDGKIKWDRGRGSDFRTISTAIYLLDGNIKIGQYRQLEKWLQASADVPQSFRDQVNDVMSTLLRLLDKRYSRAFVDYGRPKVAPVELVGIIYLISKLASSATLDQLCDCIVETRNHVSQKHESHITLNDKVGKTIIDFINTLVGRFSANKKRSLTDNDDGPPSKKRTPSLPQVTKRVGSRPSLPAPSST